MRRNTLFALIALAMASPTLLQAQTVTGTVRDQATGSPVNAAQVFIEGLDIGSLSQADGQYLIINVPAGTHTLTVQSIGYRTESVEVTVAEDASTVQNFFLASQALQLDELVVTGTAAASRVREIGNSVAVLDASVAEVAPLQNVSDLLRGRMAGVVIQQGSGDAGGASTIKIRGSSTMREVNDGPLVYIDGVRVSNIMESGSRDVSRIDDLDPAMIESIEVIKGPAAATLYGTEAANGVINITTKMGAVGDAQWNFTFRQGAQWFRDPAGRTPTNWGRNNVTGAVEDINMFRDYPAEQDLMFNTGHTQYYGIDLSGGTDVFQYFVAGSASSDQGVTEDSWAKKYNGRINVQAQPNEDLTISANAGVALTRIRLGGDQPYEEAIRATPTTLGTPLRGYRRYTPEGMYERNNNFNNANRMTAGLTAAHTPFDWLTHRFTFGLDVTDQLEEYLNPFLSPESAQFWTANQAAGGRDATRESVVYTTFDYAASGTRDLTADVLSTTSVGFQVYTRTIENLRGNGDRFPALGLSAVTATAEAFASDAFVENNTVGVYLQQQFGWQDRLFLTAAVRADDNSAFGEDFDLIVYPKVSGSWVVTDGGSGFANSFRLRAAYGESGQQPDAFAALRTFATRQSPWGSATVRPNDPGNSELGPERGVEIEAGFDASFFNDRLTIDFTYYDQRTKDAIVARNRAPSTGFLAQQFVNIGEVSNRGVEVGLSARVLESNALDWDLIVNASTNRNRIEDLGLPCSGKPELRDTCFLQLGWTTRHHEGYPVGSLFAPSVAFAEFVTNVDPSDPLSYKINRDTMLCHSVDEDDDAPHIPCNEEAWIYQGHPDPNLEISVGSSFTIGERLTVDALVQGKIGQTKYDLQGWWRYGAIQQSELTYRPLDYDIRKVAEAQFGSTGEYDLWVNEASFVRFRELSLTYQMPDEWLGPVRSTRGSLSLSARNLAMLWTNWPEWPHHDPEVVDPSNTFSGNREPQEDSAVPPLTSITLTVRLGM